MMTPTREHISGKKHSTTNQTERPGQEKSASLCLRLSYAGVDSGGDIVAGTEGQYRPHSRAPTKTTLATLAAHRPICQQKR